MTEKITFDSYISREFGRKVLTLILRTSTEVSIESLISSTLEDRRVQMEKTKKELETLQQQGHRTVFQHNDRGVFVKIQWVLFSEGQGKKSYHPPRFRFGDAGFSEVMAALKVLREVASTLNPEPTTQTFEDPDAILGAFRRSPFQEVWQPEKSIFFVGKLG